MKLLQALIIVFFTLTAKSQNKKVCISLDDLPVVSYGIHDPAYKAEITDRLINTFEKFQIPAIGFVNERKLYSYYKENVIKPDEVALLKKWLNHGYELGNHTYSHPNYDNVGYNTFTKDIIKGAQITPKISAEYGLPYRYFRHPYLRAGKTKASYDSLTSFLHASGYTIAPVTIDNADYLFAKAYSDAFKVNDTILQKKIGSEYIKYMKSKILYFEDRSVNLFGRNIHHTLLLHANLLNSRYLDKLAEVFISLGYTFASQEEVLKDPLYTTTITKFGPWGISWIDRWALSKGKKGEFFKGDPPVPIYIKRLTD